MKPRLAICIAALATSCTVGPNYKRPPQHVPPLFKSATTQEDIDSPPNTPPPISRQWWEMFGDSILNSLETQAVAANTDIAASIARVDQARAAAGITSAGMYPTIVFDPSIVRSRTPSNVTSNGGATGATTGGGSRGRTYNTARVPIDLSYELDIWGRVRRNYEAAIASARASANDSQVVLQTVQADVAQDYFQIRSLILQDQILSRTTTSYREQLELTQKQLRAGIAAQSDAAQASAQLQATIAQQVDVHRQRVDLEHALALLLGKTPAEFEVEAAALDIAPPTIPPGLPADLLRRRPDVAEAEQNLIAANAQVGAAKALFFPTFTLSGAAGFESTDVRHVFDWENRIWSIGAQASQPIFEGRQLTAGLQQARARYVELQASYRAAVLGAIRDVEDSLTDLHLRAEQAAAQDAAVKASQEYVRLATLQYRQGLTSYLQVIDAERTLLTNQLSAAQILESRLDSTVLLIKAMGGGWEENSGR